MSGGSAPRVQAAPCRIELKPDTALIDQPVSVRLTGVAPGKPVVVSAQMEDDLGKAWRSEATFRANREGSIDLTAQAPDTGSYSGVEPMGLFWSMALDKGEEPAHFLKKELTPTPITLSALADGQELASATLQRTYVAAGVTRTPVRDRGLVGTFFLPPGPGPFPAVMVMGGSGGGLREERAAVLASHGYASLALAYFLHEGLPSELRDIPLEYFETGMHWLQAQSGVRGHRLAVMGTSRGGELVLLLGATFQEVKAVVAYVPSAIVHGSVGGPRANPQPAWTHRGKPVPYLRSRTAADPALFRKPAPGEAIQLTPRFLLSLEDQDAVEEAAIPVERIGGPVLLISGKDDQMWPSSLFSDLVVRRLSAKGFEHPYTHLAYEGAGHLVSHPYVPTTVTCSRHPVTGELYAFGGNPRDGARANADSWAHVLDFLAEYLA